MPILGAHRGSFLGLPDFGITERLTKRRTAEGGSNLFGPDQQRAQAPSPQLGPQTAPAGFYPQPRTNNIPTSVTGGGSAQPAGQDILQADVGRQVDDLGAIIDRDYDTAISALGGQESSLRSQAGAAEQTIRSQAAPTRTAIGEEQATRLAGLAGQETQATQQKESGLRQARDLFRQIQQQNVAQTSGLGISSSSVSEALAERLGVETARRIAGVTGSTDEVLRNISAEKTRVGSFFKQRLADVESSLQAQIGQIQSQLLAGVNQINAARNQAASDKANRRAELLSNAQSQMAQLQANAQSFAQSLQQWQAQKAAQLSQAQQFIVSPTDFGPLQSALGNIQGLTGVGGQLEGFQPQVSISPSGKFTTTIKPGKDDDLLGNPFAG